MLIRIKFEKWGELKFIGHLDVMRYFQKAMRRADIDICYSQGFSPHQIMSFAQPLGLGITSEGEYMDIEVHSTEDSRTSLEKINAVNVPNIICTAYRLLPEKSKPAMAIMAAADYTVTFKPELLEKVKPQEIWPAYIAQEQIIIKKETKSGVSEIDIKPRIYSYELTENGLKLKLSCCSSTNLRPDTLMDNLFEFSGIELPAFSYQLHRTEMYAEDEGRFIPLMDMGTEIMEYLEEKTEESD